jgi:putative hydroxymethylpyrimidine transport system permease protein
LSSYRSTLLSDTWTTGKEILLGLAISIVSGILLAIAVHLSGLFKRAIYPLLIASQTVPSVVVAPLFVLAFGFGLLPKLGVIWLICFFPMVVNTIDGLRSVDTAYISMMRSLHASRWAIFRRVEFPAALPNMFTGARIAATYAAIGAVFAEWSGATGGLGYTIQQAGTALNTALVRAGVVVLSIVTLLLFGVVSVAQRVFVPWAGER